MNDPTFDFYNHLFGGVPGWFEVTLIHPQRAKGDNIRTRFYRLGEDAPDGARIAAMNADGWGAYYGTTVTAHKPRYGRRKEANVSMISCLWCEFDYQDGVHTCEDDVIQVSGDYAPPTALVASGGGVHCLWRITPMQVTKANRAEIKQTLRGMAVAMKADTAATDLARILRMPGTINTKPQRNGARCEIIDLLPGEYTFDTFAEYRQYAAPVRRDPVTPSATPPGKLPGYLKRFLMEPVPEGIRNDTLNKVAWGLWRDGFSLLDAESYLLSRAVALGLDERASLATIRSPFRKVNSNQTETLRRAGL